MIRKIYIILIFSLLIVSCGKKDDPTYISKNQTLIKNNYFHYEI